MQRHAQANPLLLIIAYLGFISLGLPDTLIGVSWPSVREHFALRQSEVAWIFFGSGCAYFVSSFFTGRLLKILSVGTLLALSSALVASSAFGYGWAGVWVAFAACSLLHGLGSGAIDSGLNHYVAHHFSARHMNWLHACYSAGAMLGPLIMTSVIAWHGSWRAGYWTVGGILLGLSLLFAITRRHWNDPRDASNPAPAEHAPAVSETLRHPVVKLHMLLFFVYTGLEVALGQWSFTVLTEDRNVRVGTAGLWVSIYWGSIAVGRILFGFIVERLGIDRLIRLSTVAALLGTMLFALNVSDVISAFSLALTGLGLAPIYPCIMSRTPQRLGTALAAHAIGFQVSAAMLGAAVLPSLCGVLAQRVSLGAIPMALVMISAILLAVHETILLRTRAPRQR